MKKIIPIIVVFCLILGGAYWYHTNSMQKLEQQLQQEQEQREKMDSRMEDIKNQLNNSEEEKNGLKDKIQNLKDQIDAMLVEDEYFFDSEAMMEEIKEIGELATVEYRYTNVGTLDASKKILNTDLDWLLSKKTVVVTMDGIIKVGVDVDGIKIKTDEDKKTITVTLPKPKLISNELDEDSLLVYDESSQLFNKVTMKDSSSIRSQIKAKAEENAMKNGVYDQATENAARIIRCMMESIPRLKETYSIEFK